MILSRGIISTILNQLLLLLTGLLLCLNVFPQQYQFVQFDEDDGLNNPFVNTIVQDDYGYLFVGTGEGLYRFDGLQFQRISCNSDFDPHITCSYKKEDGTLWFGNRSGGISKVSGEELEVVIPDDPSRGQIKSIKGDAQGHLWIACQSSLVMVLNENRSYRNITSGLDGYNLNDLCILKDGSTLIATDMGLLKGIKDAGGVIQATESIGMDGIMIMSITERRDGTCLVATAYDGVYLWNQSGLTEIECSQMNFKEVQINGISRGANEEYWISSNSGSVYSIKEEAYAGFQARKIGSGDWGSLSASCAFEDMESVLWLGTKGMGLLKLMDNQFVLTKPNINKGTIINSTAQLGRSIYSIGESVIYFQKDSQSDFEILKDLSSTLDGSTLNSIAVQGDEYIWLGTSNQGIWCYHLNGGTIEKIELDEGNSSNSVNSLTIKDELLYASTDFGLYILKGGKIIKHFSVTDGLKHNKVFSVFVESSDRIWIAGFVGLSKCENGVLENLDLPSNNGLPEVSYIAKDGKGFIWVATKGSGVYLSKDGGNNWTNYRKKDGLLSDYCYNIIFDLNHYMWVTHRGGLTRIETEGIEFKVYEPELASSAEFSQNAVMAYDKDILLFGTNNGLLIYSKSNDMANFREPVIKFSSILISGEEVAFQSSYNLKAGDYSLMFDFVGLSLKKPDGVQYQYMLEGYDSEWSPFSSNSRVSYGKIGPGSYKFLVRAINGDGIGGNQVHEITIFIDKPFWQKWWFIVAVILTSLMLARFVILTREKQLKRNQKILEEKLEERTHELVEKNLVLSLYNKDITDSILYAKNIQNAILPNASEIAEYFSDSFVFNVPRNIVSGDFYWIEKFGSKVIVACVDCTGHGVPGAFMSIIGTKLFKETSQRKEVESPSEMLALLDQAIDSTLNSSAQFKYLRDGMDAAVIEIDTNTLMARFSGARRPMVVVTDGVLREIKGERSSLGGNIDRGTMVFAQHEFQLFQGDSIYLFSDGITDQFGGVSNKKMKSAGFYSFIKDMGGCAMKEQGQKLERFYLDWKGNNMQVDDIIVLGFRV